MLKIRNTGERKVETEAEAEVETETEAEAMNIHRFQTMQATRSKHFPIFFITQSESSYLKNYTKSSVEELLSRFSTD